MAGTAARVAASAHAEAAIAKALSKREAFAAVKVRASATHASFTGVPLVELNRLGAALAKIEIPG